MAEHVFCRDCGTVNEQASRRLAELEETITNQAVEVAKKQATIMSLRNKQAKDRPPGYEDAMEVAAYWKEILKPSARELNGPRAEKVIARLKHFSKEELKKSLWGYSCRPNIKDGKRVRNNEGGRRWVDLELLMRDGKRVEEGIEIADAELAHDQNLLDQGASRWVAELCDCGHARGSHALWRLHQHEACMELHCECAAFDDIHRRADQWLRDQGYFDKQPNGQGALL